MRNALSIAVGASSGSSSREAKSVSTTALKLIRPRPRVTGTISAKTRRTVGSRQSRATWRRPSSRNSQGSGISTWITVPIRIENA